jgi:hypothetical protein
MGQKLCMISGPVYPDPIVQRRGPPLRFYPTLELLREYRVRKPAGHLESVKNVEHRTGNP